MNGNKTSEVLNGPGAAAILSAGLGCFLVGLFFLAEDALPAANTFFTFYAPAGALSGTTTAAVVIWLAVWWILSRAWRRKTLRMWWVNAVAFLLLTLGLLLTFPPFIDFLQGK
jgi:hypothetical protein